MRRAHCLAPILIALAGPVCAADLVRTDCRSEYCLKPSQVLSASDAFDMKRTSGRTLVVDVRPGAAAKKAGIHPGVDARIPFAGSIDFAYRMDVLRASRSLGFDDAVILLDGNGSDAALAAVNLQEWGYRNVMVVPAAPTSSVSASSRTR